MKQRGFRTGKKATKGQQARAADRMDELLNTSEAEQNYVMTHTTNRVMHFRRMYRAHVWGRIRPTQQQVIDAFEDVKFEFNWRRC